MPHVECGRQRSTRRRCGSLTRCRLSDLDSAASLPSTFAFASPLYQVSQQQLHEEHRNRMHTSSCKGRAVADEGAGALPCGHLRPQRKRDAAWGPASLGS